MYLLQHHIMLVLPLLKQKQCEINTNIVDTRKKKE